MAEQQYPKLVEGYNLLIWEHEDGSASYTGSFNRAEWDRYLADSGKEASPSADVPQEPESTEPEQPAGNASAEEWEAFARARGASDADLLDDAGEPLGRNALRDKFGGE